MVCFSMSIKKPVPLLFSLQHPSQSLSEQTSPTIASICLFPLLIRKVFFSNPNFFRVLVMYRDNVCFTDLVFRRNAGAGGCTAGCAVPSYAAICAGVICAGAGADAGAACATACWDEGT
jgi:hypothetical protein